MIRKLAAPLFLGLVGLLLGVILTNLYHGIGAQRSQAESGSPVATPAESPLAQEHPEHPQEGAEHPEHPESAKEITKDSLADAIETWVEDQAWLLGGPFLIYDKEDDIVLELKLVEVHRERLSKLEGNLYFACADFQTKNGKTYDLDMFMRQEGTRFVATEVKVHKKEGEPRYTWYEEGGFWKTKPVK